MIPGHLRVSQCKMAILQYFGKTAEQTGFNWKLILRPLEIFALLLIHLCKRNGNFCLSLDSCQSLAGKQNTTQLLSGDSSSCSVETFGVHGGEQCWASIASVTPLVRLVRCFSASGLRQFLHKQFVQPLRALLWSYFCLNRNKTLLKNSYWTWVKGMEKSWSLKSWKNKGH